VGVCRLRRVIAPLPCLGGVSAYRSFSSVSVSAVKNQPRDDSYDTARHSHEIPGPSYMRLLWDGLKDPHLKNNMMAAKSDEESEVDDVASYLA